MRKKRNWGLAVALVLPVVLMLLFKVLKEYPAVMDRWVFGVMGPVQQALGRMFARVSVSVAELMAAALLAWVCIWLIGTVVLLVRRRAWGRFVRRLLVLLAVWLWLLAGLDWLWNATYYASDFTRRSGLEAQACSVEELRAATRLFAQMANECSTRVERDAQGHFSLSVRECLDRGVNAYDGIEKEFPFLARKSVKAKPLLCSKFQSLLGFTGIYAPFTGEANVNVDAPTCLLPATIAHEMAHQRMIAAEEEANFVGIAACITCEDVAFQYSGWLMGLIHLSNALYQTDPDGWYEIRAEFSRELITDWNDNNDYWAQMDSGMEETARQAYDSFLKGNDQSMGIRSYGACVDLLVVWAGDFQGKGVA